MAIITTVQDILSRSPKTTALTVMIILSVVLLVNRTQRRRQPLPPGPSGIPILGNALQLGKFPWLTFTRLKKQYGKGMLLDEDKS
jgi:hypothetical protein